MIAQKALPNYTPAAFVIPTGLLPATAEVMTGAYLQSVTETIGVVLVQRTAGDVAGGVKGGYRFAINPETSLGVEVGYVYLGRTDARGLYTQNFAAYNGDNAKSKLQGATAGLDLRYNFSPKWYGELRGGAFFAKGEGLTNDKFNPQSVRFNSTNYYAGAGVGYNITPQWSVGLNYDYYQASDSDKNIHLPTNLYTVSAEYRF